MIDPREKKLAASIPVGAKLKPYFHLDSLDSLSESGNSIWVIAEETILKINPKSGEVVARISVGAWEFFIVSASDSAVWVGTVGSFWRWTPSYKLSKIDPQTNRVFATLAQELSWRSIRVMARTDAVWLLDRSKGTLSRLDPMSGQVVSSLPLGALSPPYWPAAVGEDSIWVANAREGTVARINPDTNQVSTTITLPYPANSRPNIILAPQFAEGAVWVACGYSGGYRGDQIVPTLFYAIDPGTNRVVATFNARTNLATGFAVGHDALWAPTREESDYEKSRLVLEVYHLPTWNKPKAH
jgi:Uncharacterized conserved protein